MLEEVISLLKIEKNAVIVDGTIGHAGHAEKLLELAGASGELYGFDWDERMLETSKENLKSVPGKKYFIHADYREIPNQLNCEADAVFLDLGVNWEHFEDRSRGFSFSHDAALDMRMDVSTKETAAAWLNRASEGEIALALREYGGERHAGLIARQIVKMRKEGRMKRTSELVEAATNAVPPRLREKRIHPATRTFQAVRIVINRELEDLEEAVSNLALKLKPKGRMAVLSYHSGEDRAVKNAFRNLSKEKGFSLLTKSPMTPTAHETGVNPSSRSAKLRAISRNSMEEKS